MKSEQKKLDVKYGDYILLGELLGTTTDNARMRYRRQREDAVKGMELIIDNRNKLLEEFKK